MHPIVSACGTSTYNLAKYLTRILKVYIGHTSPFVKDLIDKLQSIELQDNEALVSFDVSALFTSIPVNQALDVINELIIQHQTDMEFKSKVGVAWYEVADHLDREDVMHLLKVVLNNCVFSFQGKLMLMHPKDKVNPSLKKCVVYQWSCTKPNCKSSYIRKTSRSLSEHVQEHGKEGSNSAIYQHCSTIGHPLLNMNQFKVIDQEKSQIASEAKEAYTFKSWILNSIEMLAKWLFPMYLILSWV